MGPRRHQLGGVRAMAIGVLIADDHEVVRLGLRSLLGNDFQLDEAASGKEALEQFERHEFDLIVLDVRSGAASNCGGCLDRSAVPSHWVRAARR